MATVDVVSQSPNGRPSRISTLFRKLAHLKPNDIPKKTSILKKSTTSKTALERQQLNNPYPESGHIRSTRPISDIESRNRSIGASSTQPRTASVVSLPDSTRDRMQSPQRHGTDTSMSPTDGTGTKAETIKSDTGHSKARTAGGLSSTDGGVGANSTFSSPYQSQKSLATTLTTIQSNSPNQILGHDGHSNALSAVPQHLATGGPSTYIGATANNILTDDASILTLASSSRKHRRRSMDTDASVRAMAPGSMRIDSGSRESLPLSVLSGNNVESSATTPGATPYTQSRPNYGNLASTERASVYSSQSVGAPVLVSERNSYYATSLKQMQRDKDARSLDGRSVHTRDLEDSRSLFGGKSLHGAESLKNYDDSTRSGIGAHGQNDNIPSGNVTPVATSGGIKPTSSPSRTNSTFERHAMEHQAVADLEQPAHDGQDL